MIWGAGDTQAELYLNGLIEQLGSDWRILVAIIVLIGLVLAWANNRGWGRPRR
jgi:hypothetical protein